MTSTQLRAPDARPDSQKGLALVTGASSGLGVEFAKQLASRGYDLVLVARRHDRLEALAAELRASRGVSATPVTCDLGAPGAAGRLVADLDARGLSPTVLVNNAGFGAQGVAIDLPVARMTEMMNLNVVALTELSLVFGKRMAERGRGTIVNIGSTASFQPTPYLAVYGATKAYVLNFSLALGHDLAPRGVRVLALCPGGTRTEFFDSGGVKMDVGDAFFMSAEQCVRIGLEAMDAGQALVVTGLINKIMTLSSHFSPIWLATRVAGFFGKPKRLAT